MNRTNVDELLDASRPDSVEATPAMLATLAQMIAAAPAATSVASTRRRTFRWKRPVFLLPVIGIAALATTAGAVAYSFGGHPDAVIPINYVTANGHSISCAYALHIGTDTSTDAAALRKFVASRNWSGIGQKVYAEAVAHPYVPTPREHGQFTPANVDRFSFELALNEVISSQYPAGEIPQGMSSAESNCRGELH
jgi:hypothetical protein